MRRDLAARQGRVGQDDAASPARGLGAALLPSRALNRRGRGRDIVSGDWEGARRRRDRRTLAILAPTNKAASVLRTRGVPATTIHRILYTPSTTPNTRRSPNGWRPGRPPEIEGLTDAALDRARLLRGSTSVPGALAAAGLRGSDFITGWKRRESPLDIGFVDESSMLDAKQFDDLPRSSPPSSSSATRRSSPRWASRAAWSSTAARQASGSLSRIHRQEADNPILDLAHALATPS
jgi:exodeoxyribonuclease V